MNLAYRGMFLIFRERKIFITFIFFLLQTELVQASKMDLNVPWMVFSDYNSDSSYRGRILSNSKELQLGTSISYYGFSAGIRNQKIESRDNFIAHYLSYSYNFNIINFSIGYQKDDPILESEEIFAEAVFQPYKKLEAKFSYFRRLNGKSSNYTEFLLRRPWVSDNARWLAKPYVLLSAGNYHTSGFSLNHFEAGSDITYRINSNMMLSAYGSLISPLDNVKDANLNSIVDPFVETVFQ